MRLGVDVAAGGVQLGVRLRRAVAGNDVQFTVVLQPVVELGEQQQEFRVHLGDLVVAMVALPAAVGHIGVDRHRRSGRLHVEFDVIEPLAGRAATGFDFEVVSVSGHDVHVAREVLQSQRAVVRKRHSFLDRFSLTRTVIVVPAG